MEIYPTKIKKEDLFDDYIEFRSRVIWYMTGYIKASSVVDDIKSNNRTILVNDYMPLQLFISLNIISVFK